ncbi:hypothetical protein FHR92_004140 [Fontibacillus solani]|uniref:Uncharacterized protein n=1 Tax=Fontibacillus solani TaxID=1572857 RepID=A0A7W3SWY1_9BACL|nr:UPF0158 family protein [Fontibacillus solani]MBA9087655.1 hypothetical protein [Fontibacillus solani]
MRNRKRKKSALSDHESVSIDQDDQFYFIEGEHQVKELILKEHQLQDLIETYDMYMDGIEHFFNIDTGEIVMLNTFDRDDEEEELSEAIEEGFNDIYFRIPCRESSEGYMDMEDFADTVSNEKLRIKLFNVLIGGKKMFRRFKDALSSDARELDRYYKFVESRNKERVLDWLESINVKLKVVAENDNPAEENIK